MTINVTNQEAHKVLCHIWLPFPLNWWPGTRTTKEKTKLSKMAHLTTRTTTMRKMTTIMKKLPMTKQPIMLYVLFKLLGAYVC